MQHFVGYRSVALTDDHLGLTFPLAILYPTRTPEKAESVGPYRLNVARDAPIKEGRFPLVVISHGSGGSPFVYRALAHHLARSGFIVGLPEHPHNNKNDNSWEGTLENLTARPRHLCLAIRFLFEAPQFANSVKPTDVAIIGHSMGGYTALALAGGRPTSFPAEAKDGQPQSIPVVPDDRITALVLLAPATGWFRQAGALRDVGVPILMLLAEKDEATPYFHAEIVLSGVSDHRNIICHTIANAGHYSFLSPFPAAMTTPAFQPSQDLPGFDRTLFQVEMHTEIVDFLTQKRGA